MSLKLSIITVNLNNASGLRKTMESVFSQTSNDFEYILIDGGSTDESKSIIQEFEDQNKNKSIIRRFLWISEPDKGIYNAMNKGIMLSSGEYCQFLNSGDWLVNSDVTSSMLTDMPDCNIIYGNMLKHMPSGRTITNREVPVNSLLTFYNGSFNQPSAYTRRSLFEKYGLFDENLKIVSDWKFYLVAIIFNNEKVCYRNINLTNFDMTGISNTNKDLNRIERRLILEQLIPPNILADYDKYSKFILQMKRINRFKFPRKLVRLIERIIFKIEKWETIRKGEHIFY